MNTELKAIKSVCVFMRVNLFDPGKTPRDIHEANINVNVML